MPILTTGLHTHSYGYYRPMKKWQFFVIPFLFLFYLYGSSVARKLQHFGISAVAGQTPAATGTKIPIDGKRWYQLNNISNGLEGLFDNDVNTKVLTGWGKILPNYDAYYPLQEGEEITIESVRFYDGEGIYKDKPLTLSIINEQWQRIPIATFTGEKYNSWVGPYPDRKTTGDAQFNLDSLVRGARYLVINSYSVFPNEIELYGTYKAGKTPTTAPAKTIQLKGMLGVNAFEWDFEDGNNPLVINESKMKAARAFRGIRHYMDWQKLEQTQGDYTFNPTHSGGWDYDVIYERCKAEGIEVLACLKTLPNWMVSSYPTDQRDAENIPVLYGKDYTNPKSYIEQAKVAFQYAARYGSNANVERSLLSVNSKPRWTNDRINTVKVGMDLIKYIECDNERDKWWKGRKAYQTGREYAANLSAFYDGHKNTLGAGVGVKNADPNMQVVMGGIASAYAGTDYVQGMVDWCKEFRGYKADGKVDLCWDVINYHLYSDNTNSSQGGSSSRGAAPEVSTAIKVAKNFIQMAHQIAYDMPVWITETGYDVNQGSPLKAIAVGNKTVLQTQADWILRTAMFYARAGIDRVFFYQMYDDNATNPVKFSSSGLINDNQTRKPAADYLCQFNKLLGEYYYKETLNSDPIVDRYELNGQSAYALVVPDEKGRTAEYSMDLDGAGWANVYTPVVGSDSMQVEKVQTTGGKLKLSVTETPIFVVPFKDSSVKVGAFQIYPNPATDHINVALNNANLGNLQVSIFNVRGQLYKQLAFNKSNTSFTAKVDLSTLPFGLYVVEVKQGTQKMSYKILKSQ